MPCFLNVIVGSNSVAAASRAEARSGVVHLDDDALSRRAVVDDEHRAAGPGGLGGVLEQIGQDALHQIGVGVGARPRGIEPERDTSVDGMRRAQQRDALGDERVDVERFRTSPAARSANSENARTRRSSVSISLTTIWTA